jgi:hypothetical protein
MNKQLLAAIVLFCAGALNAATYYAAPTGTGTTCSDAVPCLLSSLITKLAAGDTGILKPGTYTGTITISKSGASGSPITLQAQNKAVHCPAGDDSCYVSTSNRSLISARVFFDNADYWVLDGMQHRNVLINNASNITIKNSHLMVHGDTAVSASYSDTITVEDSYITKIDDSLVGDYGFRTFTVNDVTVDNVYIAGAKMHHGISLKKNGTNYTLNRIVCEGTETECINVGQEGDNASNYGGAVCVNKQRNDGSYATVYDGTVANVTASNIFTTGAVDSKGLTESLYGVKVGSVNGLTVSNFFAANVKYYGAAIFVSDPYPTTNPLAECGIQIDNIVFRGGVIDRSNGTTYGACFAVAETGYTSSVKIENFVCLGQTPSAAAITWAASKVVLASAFTTMDLPSLTVRNNTFTTCSSTWLDRSDLPTPTHGYNNSQLCTGKSGTGDLAVSPQFVGPTGSTTPPTLPRNDDASVTSPEWTSGRWADGAKLWDWAGYYQPIIDRYRTQQAAFVDGGYGSASPCTGAACDIGANEFFTAGDEPVIIGAPTDIEVTW